MKLVQSKKKRNPKEDTFLALTFPLIRCFSLWLNLSVANVKHPRWVIYLKINELNAVPDQPDQPQLCTMHWHLVAEVQIASNSSLPDSVSSGRQEELSRVSVCLFCVWSSFCWESHLYSHLPASSSYCDRCRWCVHVWGLSWKMIQSTFVLETSVPSSHDWWHEMAKEFIMSHQDTNVWVIFVKLCPFHQHCNY